MAQVIEPGRRLGRELVPPMARSEQPELLDGEVHDPGELAENFRDIERVNQLLGGTATVMRHLWPLLGRVPADRTATILDLASGSADIPLAIAHQAGRRGRAVRIVASDAAGDVLALAQARVGDQPDISFARYDARDVPLPDGAFDVVLCSLALHHFPPDDAVRVLREMNRLARVGLILNDLRRGRLGWAAAWVAARLTTRNHLTRHDAPLSVRRAYTVREIEGLLRRAGIEDARITTHRWFRLAAVRTKVEHGG